MNPHEPESMRGPVCILSSHKARAANLLDCRMSYEAQRTLSRHQMHTMGCDKLRGHLPSEDKEEGLLSVLRARWVQHSSLHVTCRRWHVCKAGGTRNPSPHHPCPPPPPTPPRCTLFTSQSAHGFSVTLQSPCVKKDSCLSFTKSSQLGRSNVITWGLEQFLQATVNVQWQNLCPAH